ncbi:MAG: hypothetical protein R3B90_20550 [Planctomycetaceae bacterium]
MGRTEVDSVEQFRELIDGIPASDPVLLRVRRIAGTSSQTRLVIWDRQSTPAVNP